RSERRLRENCWTNAFVAPYALPPAYGHDAATEPMLITCPRLRATIPGSTARVQYVRPLMFVSTMTSQSSTSAVCAGLMPRARPALLTRRSGASNGDGSDANVRSTAARSRTSSVATWTVVFFESSSFAASRRSARRAASTSRHPSAANRRAHARPKPLVAPVITAVFVMRGKLRRRPEFDEQRLDAAAGVFRHQVAGRGSQDATNAPSHLAP